MVKNRMQPTYREDGDWEIKVNINSNAVMVFIIWLRSLSGLYTKSRTLIGCLAEQLAGKFKKEASFSDVLQKIYNNKLPEK